MPDEYEPMLTPTVDSTALNNMAVATSWRAWYTTYSQSIDQGKDHEASRKDACKAYRAAMPPLAGFENIQNFIACVAHGILIEAITTTEGSRLLYAAQVAGTTLRSQPPKPDFYD